MEQFGQVYSFTFLLQQLEMEFMRVTNVPLRRTFFSTLDREIEIISTIVKERGGSSGKKISASFSHCASVVSHLLSDIRLDRMNDVAQNDLPYVPYAAGFII